MTSERINLIEQFIEQYMMLHHEVALIKHRRRAVITSPAQMGILFILYKFGKCSVSQLAQLTRTTSGAVTQIIDNLVRHGLVERSGVEKDKRVVEIIMTEQGEAQFKARRRAKIAELGFLFDDLTDQELTTMTEAQAKLIKNIANHKKDKA